jgi:hypothetical protein
MHSAILSVTMPAPGHDGDIKWRAFLATIAPFENDQAVAQLGPNVWQVNFQQSPAAFAHFVAAFELHKLPYGILPLADAPQWLPASFHPGKS